MTRREAFHRLDLRLERVDTKLDQLEKRLSDGLAVVNARFGGLREPAEYQGGKLHGESVGRDARPPEILALRRVHATHDTMTAALGSFRRSPDPR